MNEQLKKVVIIGGGPGGYHTAVRLAKNPSVQVALIDKASIGGTCLNVGCIPTKVLLDHLSLFEHFIESSKRKNLFNISSALPNTEGLRKFQLEVIGQLQQGLGKLFEKRKITFLSGEAKLISNKKILVKSEGKSQEIEADDIVIACGSKPKTVPTFQLDGKEIISSDNAWNISNIPEKLLIIGSGPIGIEFARIFNTLGSKVTIAEIQDKICPILDNEISENLVRSLKRRGVMVKPNFASKYIEKKEGKILVEFLSTTDGKKETDEFNQVLVAVGREPNTQGLGLESLGIETLPGGFIKVDQHMKTSIKNIWALGDVTNYPQLAHTASSQAKVVSKNILGKAKTFQGNLIPSCIFGYPEIAFVGSTEEELKEKKIEYRAGKYLFLASGKGKASGLTEGLVKILMNKSSKKILGAHIIGAEASNLIQELVVAMQNDLTIDEITESIHIHPAYSEVVLEALEDCLGEAVHI